MGQKYTWYPAAHQLLKEELPTHVKPFVEWSLDELQLSVTRSSRVRHALRKGHLPVFPCSKLNLGFIPGKRVTLFKREGDALLLPGGRLLIGVFDFEDSAYFVVGDIASLPINGLLLPLGSQRFAQAPDGSRWLKLIPQYEAKDSIVILIAARYVRTFAPSVFSQPWS